MGQLRVEHDRRPAAERDPTDAAEARLGGQAERAKQGEGLGGEPAGAGLGTDLGAFLRYERLAPALGQDLGGAKPGRASTDDQVLDTLHAGSSRRRAAAAARSAWVGLRATPARRSHMRALR